MLERMMEDDLRYGRIHAALEHAREVEKIVRLQVLETVEAMKLQLLAARLLDVCSEAVNDEYARRVDLFVGYIFASGQSKGPVLDESKRFRVRVYLNRGELERARHFADRIDRRMTIISSGFGQGDVEKPHDNEEMITPPTWLLLAEMALAEGNFDEAARAVENARTRWGQSAVTAEEGALYELLCALVQVGRSDQQGVAALARLYSIHVLSESTLDIAMKARISSAAGFIENLEAISKLESARWRSLGPPEHESVEAYLGLNDLEQSAADILQGVEIDELVDGIGRKDASVARATVAGLEGLAGLAASNELPSDFSLEEYRLDSITGFYDLNRITGPILIDWGSSDESLVAEAVESKAISELALEVKSATIFFNNGSYVDAVFNSDDERLLSFDPGDVIFEVYRIAMCRFPKSRARQLAAGPEAAHEPERMNVRAEDFNMDVVRRFDEMNAALSGYQVKVEEEEEDPFANWNSFGPPGAPEASEVETHISSPELAASVLVPFEAIFSADSLQKICDAVISAVKELGESDARIEIVGEDMSSPVSFAGVETSEALIWSVFDAGQLKLRLGMANVSGEYQHVVKLIMDAALHRLRVMPGSFYRGQVIEVPDFVAADSATQKLLETVRTFARMDKNFLITGERGTGKERIASFLHQWSSRAEMPFVRVDGGAINNPDQLAAELFGAKKGSYSGSVAERRGVVQAADGGDLFIDEIDEGVSVQSVLKRFAQFRTYKSLGDSKEAEADVRLFIATNRIGDGEGLIKDDLRDRFWEIRVPALRERRADIRPLAELFARNYSMVLPDSVLSWLETLDWPGNVRQLENTVERACSLAESPAQLTLSFLDDCVERTGGKHIVQMKTDDGSLPSLLPGESLNDRMMDIERQYILTALRGVGGNKTQAAEMLGMKRQTLHSRCRALGIDESKEFLMEA